jgi:hypothetical protein
MDFWREICITRASYRGGPWIWDFFGPWNGTSEAPPRRQTLENQRALHHLSGFQIGSCVSKAVRDTKFYF